MPLHELFVRWFILSFNLYWWYLGKFYSRLRLTLRKHIVNGLFISGLETRLYRVEGFAATLLLTLIDVTQVGLVGLTSLL